MNYQPIFPENYYSIEDFLAGDIAVSCRLGISIAGMGCLLHSASPDSTADLVVGNTPLDLELPLWMAEDIYRTGRDATAPRGIGRPAHPLAGTPSCLTGGWVELRPGAGAVRLRDAIRRDDTLRGVRIKEHAFDRYLGRLLQLLEDDPTDAWEVTADIADAYMAYISARLPDVYAHGRQMARRAVSGPRAGELTAEPLRMTNYPLLEYETAVSVSFDIQASTAAMAGRLPAFVTRNSARDTAAQIMASPSRPGSPLPGSPRPGSPVSPSPPGSPLGSAPASPRPILRQRSPSPRNQH